ncbi:MAG TPA: MFS transporter [Prolixibacteraceae bacterium]|nr:MFS transporter [Prolixibacteraceae bacterium]HPR86018.1 MFS transporter [Prolixibacteraceae bacterium]
MATKPKTNFRWLILSLLFVATTILYVDRSALGILAPELQQSIGWSEEQYGIINSVFMIAYALCFILMGRLIDIIGTRNGYLVSIAIWSIATLGHVLSRSWVGFAVARFSLAVGQSGSFPSAIKAVAEWFPKKDRALAVGIFNGGANMGTILSPLIIPLLVLHFDNWRVGFLWTFPISILWVLLWLKYFKKPEQSPNVSAEELQYINSDGIENENTEKVGWKDILPHRGAWAIAVAKFMADPIWWFYLFWGAKFLNAEFGLNLKEIGLPFFTIYLASWGLGIFLGWFSSKLMKTGFSLNKGRKLGLLACALFAVPVALVPHTENVWMAVGLIALAAGGHCGWSANVFSLMSDIFPKKAIGTVAGFGGFAGAVGGAIVAFSVGKILQNIGVDGYSIPFAIAGCGYLIALLIVHLLVPRIKTIEI